MPISDDYEKAMLDWVLGGATPTRPASRWLSFATGSPNAAGASDGPFIPRCTVTFGAAASPAGSATNANAISATASAAGTAIGWNLWNSSVGGTRIAFGTLTAALGCKSADNPALSAGTLRITLS